MGDFIEALGLWGNVLLVKLINGTVMKKITIYVNR
jgi:hypothetical protein